MFVPFGTDIKLPPPDIFCPIILIISFVDNCKYVYPIFVEIPCPDPKFKPYEKDPEICAPFTVIKHIDSDLLLVELSMETLYSIL
jgi:hypothetical protein